ncbi:hypothetical protein, partial [Mesorhizobium sp. A556]
LLLDAVGRSDAKVGGNAAVDGIEDEYRFPFLTLGRMDKVTLRGATYSDRQRENRPGPCCWGVPVPRMNNPFMAYSARTV